MTDDLPPVQKHPPIDLDRFTHLTEERLEVLTIIKRLGFIAWPAKYRELKPLLPGNKSTKYSAIHIQKKNCEIVIKMFSDSGGYYLVSIKQPGYFASKFSITRYFELNDPESEDRKCLKLRHFKGSLEEQVEQSLTCINRIMEERFEGVLKGDEWLEVPPSFYDYK